MTAGAAPTERGHAAGSVLHFAADWLPASEGFVYDLVTHLRRPGIVAAANRLQNTDRFTLPALHSLAPVERFVRPMSVRPFATTKVLNLICRRSHVAVVHAHHGYRVDVVAPSVRRLELPLVLSLHGHDVTGYLEEVPRAYADVASLVSAVVVPSRFLVPFATAAGFDSSIVRVLPSGIDTSFFAPSPLPHGDPTVLFVGRFVAKKGLDTLGTAWASVQHCVPEARLRLLGFGPLEDLARSIPGRVTVDIAPDRDTVRAAMTEATLVVSPSHMAHDDALESLLVVNLEAQASARPVVTTRHGGIPEYVREGETALVVPESDPDSLAAALTELLEDRALAEKMGAAGPAWASQFDVRKTARDMDDLYDEVISGPTRSSA